VYTDLKTALVLLIERGPPEAADVRKALEANFTTRAPHPVPKALQPPRGEWGTEFMGMAREAGLSTMEYLETFEILERFWTTHGRGAGAGG
jgi:hypothetical protein